MSISLVQSTAGAGSSLAYGSANASGNTLICVLQDSADPAGITLSDTRGNTWAKAIALNSGLDSLSVSIWYAANCAAGSNTLTVAGGSSGSFQNLALGEYSGLATSSPLDKTAVAESDSGNPDSGATATTSQASELLIGAVALDSINAVTWTGSWTGRQTANNGANRLVSFADQVVSSTGAYHATATFTGSSNWMAAVASFKAASGGDTTAPVVASANVNSAGTTLTINFTEAGSPPVLPASSVTGFTLTASGGAVTLSSTAISSTTFTATTSRTIDSGETLTLAYTPGNVTDSASTPNALASFSGTSVTNNSTQAAPLAAGTASFDSCGPAGGSAFIKMTATDATNGTPSYTYQWQRKTGSGGSYSNLTNGSGVSGATTRTLTDGSATSGNDYFYRLNYTDSAGSPATVSSGGAEAQVYTGGALTGTGSVKSGQRRRGR